MSDDSTTACDYFRVDDGCGWRKVAMTERRNLTTTDSGQPAPSDEFSQSAGSDGPLLLQDHYLIQKMAQFNRGGGT
jgi:catalase